MRTLAQFVGLIALLAGVAALGYALVLPYTINQNDLSAIQMTQVYTMGLYYAVIGVGAFVFAGVCLGGARERG